MSIISAIIILNYNDGANTKKLAEHIKSHETFSHIILVDNCSTDDSFSVMKSLVDDKIDVIQTTANQGYACGNNYGAWYAIEYYQPDYLFIANPDIMVTNDVASDIVNTLQTNPEYGALSCIVNQGYNVWNLPGFLGMIESLFLIWFNLDKKAIKQRLLSSSRSLEPVGVVEGSFFCIRRSAFEQINGFDNRTFLYVEENILARRLKNFGYMVGVLTTARYDHYHSVSIKKEYRASKARAFHLFYDSMKLYNQEYLHTNFLQNILFELCYGVAYLERMIYDFIMKFR